MSKDDKPYSSLFKNRGFLGLWTNQILVQFAYNCLNFSLIIWVFYLTNSNTAVAALLLSVYLPALLFGIFSGVFVDMIDRKKIIITIDIVLSLLFISLMFFQNSFFFILIFTFLINTLAQFYVSAESSALPILVKTEQLFRANSLFFTTLYSMFLIGFGSSGPIISSLGIDFIFIIGSVSLFLAFILANSLPSINSKSNKAIWKLSQALINQKIEDVTNLTVLQIKETFKIIRGKLSVLSALIILASVQAIVGAFAVLMPSFLENTLQISATDASYIIAIPLGVGMVLGAIAVGRIGVYYPRRTLVANATLIVGSLLFLVGIAPLLLPAIQYFPKPQAVSFLLQPPLSLITGLGSLLMGASVVTVIIPSQTVLQENTPKENRGKVFGVLVALMSGLSIIPVLTIGILSDLFGTRPIFIGLGGIIALFGFLILRPDFFFEKYHLPFKVREFLGLGHWEK